MPETFDPSSQSLAETTVLDQSHDSHIDQLQRAAIGPVNADYYLPILSRFETYDRGSPSWNWAACLCTLNWMVFRGMWTPALAYLGGQMLAVAALFAVTLLAAPMAASVEWGLWAALITLAFLVPGFFGNIWLFGHYRLRLAQALSATPTVHDACRLLGRQASSRRRLVLLLAANGVLALSVAAVWLWPSTPLRESARVDHGELRVEALPPALPASHPVLTRTDTAPPSQLSASAPDASASDVVSATVENAASALPTSAAGPTPKSITSPAPTLAAADAGIRHAAIAARSRKAHQEQTAPVAAASAPIRPDVAPPPAPVPVGRYLINVGLFAQEDNARRAFDRLRAAGLPSTTQEVQRGSNTLTRVRVGPFATRAQAEAAAQEIRALQLDAVVIRL